jgi:hypothetical protein
MQITRQEAWQRDYRGDRYLRELPNDALLTRAGDLMSAMLIHTADGKIGLKPIGVDAWGMERLTHALEEMAIRGLDQTQPGMLESLNIPKPAKVRRALSVMARRTWPEPILVKFGKRRHMAALFLEGKGRISPASFYNDPSLGRARSDNEAQIAAYLHPVDAHRFSGVRQYGNGGSSAVYLDVPFLGSTRIELQATTDFYVYCMAESCDARMFEDFDDTCVVIKRPAEFTSRIQDSINASLPGWKFITAPVIYFDPFFSRPHQMVAQLYKHFRFSYQKEHRLLWVPPSPEAAEDHIPFDIGPLTAYAEFIWL